jgi:hypothetical protein
MNKAQLKAAARETLAASVATIADVSGFVLASRKGFEQRIGRYEVLIAVALSQGAEAVETIGGKTTWKEWGAKQLPHLSASSLYRWRNAGDVARVLYGNGSETEPNLLGDLPAAMVGSLVPLYRVLDLKARSDEARAKGRMLARSTYADLLKSAETMTVETREGETISVPVAPEFAAVLAAAEAVSPTNRGGGGKASETDETETAETAETDQASSAHLTTVDVAAVEAATGPVSAILAGLMREHGTSETITRGIMLAACRLAGEHGVGPVAAILSGVAPSPETIAEASETETDAQVVETIAAETGTAA